MLEAVNEAAGRDALVAYLRAELIGPAGEPDEVLRDPPHRRYLMGALYPQQTDTTEMSELEGDDAVEGSVGEELADDPVNLAHEWMPSSFGMSFFVVGTTSIECRVSGARYETEFEGRAKKWRRIPMASVESPEVLAVQPDPETRRTKPVSVLEGRAVIDSYWRPLGDGHLVTVTLVNAQVADDPDKIEPEQTLHQLGLSCSVNGGVVREYPHVDALSTDHEDAELRLLHRKAKVFAVGHGCSVAWADDAGDSVEELHAEFMPTWSVPALTQEGEEDSDVLSLAMLSDEAVPTALLTGELVAFIDSYEAWIQSLPAANTDIGDRFALAQARLLNRLQDAADRMRRGVELLENDAVVRRAFRLANRAMLMQMRHAQDDLAGVRRKRDAVSPPAIDYLQEGQLRWYPFQLAFQLLTLCSVVDEESDERALVDLLWFPTGGGKTEAYLAVSALVIFLRRLRAADRGGGTAIITRYTLRLLTAQQFQRAAALMCACELIRRDLFDEMGSEPLTIGLWVGEEAAPNTFSSARALYEEMLDEAEPRNRFQLERCPWCGTELVPEERDEDAGSYGFESTPSSFRFFCPTASCPFHDRLPVAVVDEELYDRPPTVLIATVDKFARLAWVERAGEFFGAGGKYEPPSLIIQDELHLLSGPLGTTVGLYEAAIEALINVHGPPPKVVASTATIRRADEQAEALFGKRVRLFPPAGLDANDSYFARVDSTRPGRLYVGVMAPGHTISTAVIHTGAALLQAPLELDLSPVENDSYSTLVIYHNSLRELGRTVTLARDDIPARVKFLATDESKIRKLEDDDVVELTGNVSGKELPTLLSRMELPARDPNGIDLLATTNMLSVGVDIRRLGAMLVNGQPKTTSEYIQATSRVGRGEVPGLVVTLFTSTKPRDRSHYESFLPYHAALYRSVEPTSVTPFSAPSRVRALHAALVILIRHGAGLSADDDAGRINPRDAGVRKAVETLSARVAVVDRDESDATARQLNRLLEEWEDLAAEARARGQDLYYKPHGKQHLSLLKDFEARGAGWETLHSMRSVDRSCEIEVLGAK